MDPLYKQKKKFRRKADKKAYLVVLFYLSTFSSAGTNDNANVFS